MVAVSDELYMDQLYDQDSEAEDYATFTFNDWRELVEERLISSELRQTCDMFAENTIEEARRLRLARFIGELEEILDDLVSSLSYVTSSLHIFSEHFSSVTLGLNRAPLNELVKTQRQTEETLSDLQQVLNQCTPGIEEVRTQQESKLNEALLRFERVASESANEAIALCEASLLLVRALN